MAVEDIGNHGLEFLAFGLVHHVRVIHPDHGAVGWNHRHIKVVDFLELNRFRIRGSGHASQFIVHAEVILDRYARKSLIFLTNPNALLGFDGLMQPIRPASAGHETTGKFINDDDFAVLNYIVNVALKNGMSLQRLVDMVQGPDLRRVIQVTHTENTLNFRYPLFGERCGSELLVNGVIDLALETWNNSIERVIFLGGFFCRAGNNQWRPSFINQDVIHFINNGKMQFTLDIIFKIKLHIIA